MKIANNFWDYQYRKENFKVIVFGIGGTLKDALSYIRMRFDIVGCSDSNPAKADNDIIPDVPFYEKAALASQSFDYILLVSVADTDIKEDLIQNFHIPKEKILLRSEWDRMVFHYSYGEKNPDKTFYVFSRPIRVRNGLYSYVFDFLDQMERIRNTDLIPVVDMQSFPSQYVSEEQVGNVNAWNLFFEPLSEYSLAEVYQSKNVIFGFDSGYYPEHYEQKYDFKKLQDTFHHFIHLNSSVRQEIDAAYHKLFKDRGAVLGVLYRGTDMKTLHLRHHAIQPEIQEIVELAKERMAEWDCDSIFLSTESEDAVQAFAAAFGGKVFYTDQVRFRDTGNVWLANIHVKRENDPYLRGIEYLTTISLLSKCDSMLGGICTASFCAPIQKDGEYKHFQLINKGYY